MKSILFSVLFCCLFFSSEAQKTRFKAEKYPSLLWEITGNGMKKPSYLFGTMHVSNKMAFFLSDSFYIAIRSVDLVGLENDPSKWQEDMDRYGMAEDAFYHRYYDNGLSSEFPSDYLRKPDLAVRRYEKGLEAALYAQPMLLNSLLYRNYEGMGMDFQEDTYLDLYIFQAGKKLGKKMVGVEDYAESLRLVMEASRDAELEKNKLKKSYDFDPDLSEMRLQEAYRSGNLDWLDTIHKANSQSAAFDEKFMYRRNEIQARSIDSILKKKQTLFVGVGAAHLPGSRGVIEILRAKGYKLRPIMMTKRDNQQKELIEKMRVPVQFKSQTATDAMYTVDVPGKLYEQESPGGFSQAYFADMGNGSYYVVTRLRTHHRFWGDTEEDVLRKIDSVLYENIPGKIISKTAIEKNGYKGWDITNRTRTGDYQRYNVYVTPLETILFKISGRGEYIQNGTEAKQFFESIQLKPLRGSQWTNFTPAHGSFQVSFPHPPFSYMSSAGVFQAFDSATGNTYAVMQVNVHNYAFAGEDSFDLELMKESFGSAEYIDSLEYSSFGNVQGYPSRDLGFRHKDSSIIHLRFIIRGPHYYVLMEKPAHAKSPSKANAFFNSFRLEDFKYGKEKEVIDTALAFRVRTPWYPKTEKKGIELPKDYGRKPDDEQALSEFSRFMGKGRFYYNDTTGEGVYFGYWQMSRYGYKKDTLELLKTFLPEGEFEFREEKQWIYRSKKEYTLNNARVWEVEKTEKGSSRVIREKYFLRNGIFYYLASQGDTLSKPGSFVTSFFNNLKPADTVKGSDPFKKKADLFFQDLASKDTLIRMKALSAAVRVDFDSTDANKLIRAIEGLSWKDKEYLNTKSFLISQLARIQSKSVSDWLKSSYLLAGDTLNLQKALLFGLVSQRTQYGMSLFQEIMKQDPPILEVEVKNNYNSFSPTIFRPWHNGSLFTQYSDSLKLWAQIYPDLLPLVNLEDYRDPVLELTTELLDSALITKSDYESYYSKFRLEARHELRKQLVTEKTQSIEKASRKDEEENYNNYYVDFYSNREEDGKGNSDLIQYAALLLPFWDQSKDVPEFFNRMLGSSDKQLRYDVLMMLIAAGKPFPDTLVNFFARDEKRKPEFYDELKRMKKLDLFPRDGFSQSEMARARLLQGRGNGSPDSLIFVDRKWVEASKDTGYLYFFKYKMKKDDPVWKLAYIGLFSGDTSSASFFERKLPETKGWTMYPPLSVIRSFEYASLYYSDFTSFTDLRLDGEKPVSKLINDSLKELLIGEKPAAAQFYSNRNNYYDYAEGVEEY